MFESRDSNPFYQGADLDFDAARAEWERGQDHSAAYANHTAETATARYVETTYLRIPASAPELRDFLARAEADLADAGRLAAWPEFRADVERAARLARAEMATHPGPTPAETGGWPL